MDEAFSSELDAWLSQTNGQQFADNYVVWHTLKQTPDETTEVVYLRDDNGNAGAGPFVRKRFVRDAGRGRAYEQIFRAQVQGIRLEHQPILYACAQEGEALSVVMEYVHGDTLRDAVLRDGPGTRMAARVMPALCDAIAELHETFEQPLIHRDIKPSNVMLAQGRIVVIDLGIARTYRSGAQHDTMRYGTPGYAPPEQFGYGQTSVRSDVYALGMTLAFCLTGQDPTPDLRESSFADPRIPPALREVLAQATALDPSQRHASARELKACIEHALGLEPRVTPSQGSASIVSKPDSFLQRVKDGRALLVVGVIWNCALVTLWGLFGVACVQFVQDAPVKYPQYPFWFMIVEIFLLMFVPWSCGTYLLLDKRRLRKRWPLSKFTWRRELRFLLLLAVVCIVVSIAALIAIYPFTKS